jgi:LmbE family N-acetylglucosaminyl deacetylase
MCDAPAQMPLLPYPKTWPSPPRGRVLVLAAHADDETMGCGGAIARHVAQGDPVAIAIATDGMLGDPEGRYAGQDYRAIREREAAAAARILGASEPEGWRFPDQGLQALVAQRPSPLVHAVTAALERLRPDVVYTTPDTEMHPDHQALGAAVRAALAAMDPARRPRAFGYETWVPTHPTHLLDVTAVYETKERAIAVYASQLAYVDYRRAVRGMNVARAIFVPGAEYVEGFEELRF